MAQPKRLKLSYESIDSERLAKAFRGIGEDAKDFLEYEIVYGEDPGRRSLAREILGYAEPNQQETKIKKNVEE